MPDVYAASDRFEQLGVPFIKKPDGGKWEAFFKVVRNGHLRQRFYWPVSMDGCWGEVEVALVPCDWL